MYLKEKAEKRAEEKLVIPSLNLEKINKPQKYEKQLYLMKSDFKKLYAWIAKFKRQIWKEHEEVQSE